MNGRLSVTALVGFGLVLLFGFWSVEGAFKSPYESEAAHVFSTLPIQANGRVKPMDSIAREALMFMSHKQTLKVDGERWQASEWYLNVLTQPDLVEQQPFIRIIDDSVKQDFKLPLDEKMFAIQQLSSFYPDIKKKALEYQDIDKQQRTYYQREMVNLYLKLALYFDLKQSLFPSYVQHRQGYIEKQKKVYDTYGYLIKQHPHGQHEPSLPRSSTSAPKTDAEKIAEAKGWSQLSLLVNATQYYDSIAVFSIIPQSQLVDPTKLVDPLAETPQSDNNHKWLSASVAVSSHIFSEKEMPILLHYAGFLDHISQADTYEKGLSHVQALADAYKIKYPDIWAAAQRESFFNRVQFFYKALVLYVGAALFVGLSMLFSKPLFFTVGYRLALLALVIQTVGLVFRMLIQGRPPVTNLYSSAVFIGLIAVLMGLFFERIFKNKLGTLMAGIIGFITLIIAHHLSIQGDTLEMMQAVLDSNFWLATHVVVVTIGYSGMFLAGGIGLVYVIRRFFFKSFPAPAQKELYSMAYASICFSLALSFIGTVLGGIWADQSWGRFWGWDPKENGALLIVIWCAILLHGRLGGLIKARGFMVGAIFGNVVTAFSWFGVNMLGVGLHSYGFMDEAFFWLVLFSVIQFFFMGLGILPSRWVTPKINDTLNKQVNDAS